MSRLAFSMAALLIFFFQAEDGIRDIGVTGVQTCALPIYHFMRKPTTIPAAFIRISQAQQVAICNDFTFTYRSEERRVGKSVDLGGRRIIKKKKTKKQEKDAGECERIG